MQTEFVFRNLDRKIDNFLEYIREQIEKDPYLTISVGCDSILRKDHSYFVVTLMFNNNYTKRGSHILYCRLKTKRHRSSFDRLSQEYLYAQELASYIHENLSDFVRKDLSAQERRRYKVHLQECAGELSNVDDVSYYNKLQYEPLTQTDMQADYKKVDIHLDFNPVESTRNKSNEAYKAYVNYLRDMGFRVWAKPQAPAASCAADHMLPKKATN